MKYPQTKRAKAALAALKPIYPSPPMLANASEEAELLTRFLTDLRLLASEGDATLDVHDCVRQSQIRWTHEHR